MNTLQVRGLLVQKLSEIPVHNLDTTKQVSAAITQVVLKPEELDPQTQVSLDLDSLCTFCIRYNCSRVDVA